MATDEKNEEGGAIAILIFILIFAVVVYIVFKCSKFVFTYSRSALLAVWTFLVLSILLWLSFVYYKWDDLGNPLLIGFWVAGVVPIFFSTYFLYKNKKSEVDELVKKEASIEQQVSKGRSSSVKLFTGAGALYAGYKLGKKTG